MTTEYTFPEKCFYCFDRLGSEVCLLPYGVILKFDPPTRHENMVMEVTVIHENYSLNSLQHNFDVLRWMRSRPSSQELRSYATSMSSQCAASAPYATHSATQTDEDLPKHDLACVSTDEAHQREATSDSDSSLEKVANVCSTVDTQSVNEDTTSRQLLLSDLFKDTQRSIGMTDLAFPEQRSCQANHISQTQTRLSQSAHQFTELDQQSEDHVVSDLVRAMITVYNLHAKQRTSITMSALIESISTELDRRSSYGNKYKVQSLTSLDHNIALAREIQDQHSYQDLFRWLEYQSISQTEYCLLNSPNLSPVTDDDQQITMARGLTEYIKSILASTSIPPLQGRRIVDKVKADLIARGYPTTYQWIVQRLKTIAEPRSVRSHSISKSSTQSELPEAWIKKQRPDHACPAIQEDIQNAIDTKLLRVVIDQIRSRGARLPILPEKIQQVEFFYLLASEFIKHNKGWMNSNSLTEVKHLQKIERYVNVRFPDKEALPILHTLRKIIDDFRSHTKELRQQVNSYST